MPSPWRVLSPVWTGVFLVFLGGCGEAPPPPVPGSDPQAGSADVRSVQLGALYRLSAATPIVMEPDPELHAMEGVTEGYMGMMEMPQLDPVPASTVVRVSRTSVVMNVIWYELRSEDGASVHGWASVDDLESQELTRVE